MSINYQNNVSKKSFFTQNHEEMNSNGDNFSTQYTDEKAVVNNENINFPQFKAINDNSLNVNAPCFVPKIAQIPHPIFKITREPKI